MSDEFRTALGRAEERINERQDKLIERVEEGIARVFAKVDLRMDASDKVSEIERREIKRALDDLRDLGTMQGRRITELEGMTSAGMKSSAEGAAKGAGEAAGKVATEAAAVIAAQPQRQFWATWLGKAVVVAVGFTALVTAIGSIPSILRTVDAMWRFLEGLAK